MLYKTGSLSDQKLYNDLSSRCEQLERKINNFRQSVIAAYWQPKDQIGSQLSEDDTD